MIVSIIRAWSAMIGAGLSIATVQPGTADAQGVLLEKPAALVPRNVTVEPVDFAGRNAIKVTTVPAKDDEWIANPKGSGGGIVVVPNTAFHNGAIEVDVASRPKPGAMADARGFAGLAFHVNPEGTRQEHVYLRPTNGRSEDQLRRNHSIQYASTPDYEWDRLRKEHPGLYETYVDVEPGKWMHLRLEVEGTKMRAYVNGVVQPTLVVNDLKMGDATGNVALWIGVGAEAYFTNLVVKEKSGDEQ